MNHITLGSRVYYADNGPTDTGTIIDILLEDAAFVVKWDKQEKSRYIDKTFSIPQFNKSISFSVNPANENIDQFYGNQLVIIE